jgi:hypothetical protein
MNPKNNSQKEKGAGIVFLLDLLFVLVGVGLLVIYLLKNEAFLKWLFKR